MNARRRGAPPIASMTSRLNEPVKESPALQAVKAASVPPPPPRRPSQPSTPIPAPVTEPVQEGSDESEPVNVTWAPPAAAEAPVEPAKKTPAAKTKARRRPATAKTQAGEGSGPVIGASPTVQTSVWIDPNLAGWVRDQARDRRIPQTAVILDALNQAARQPDGWGPLVAEVAAPARTVQSSPDDLFQWSQRADSPKEMFKIRATKEVLAQIDDVAAKAEVKRSVLIAAAVNFAQQAD